MWVITLNSSSLPSSSSFVFSSTTIETAT
jgi:hypothetical protein